jgi:hypothetical protein
MDLSNFEKILTSIYNKNIKNHSSEIFNKRY